jgi:2-polyprenyl-6-methoxyphenol hydroxylase-like FAD-dependent oxidoreductase
MSSVLIVGAGPAGVVAALCLARRGHAVTILDKDSLPPRSLDEWQRQSVQQIGQGHSLLALGTDILARECPDVVARMIDDGAHRVPLAHDSTRWNLFIRRKRFDATFRTALVAQPGANLLAGVAASGLLIRSASGNRPPHVFGVRTPSGDITADVVIDAGGRHSAVPRWLSQHGIRLGVRDDPTTFFYLTRHYRLKPGRSFPSTKVPIVVALAYATVLAFPEDGDFFQLTIQLDGNDRTKRRLRDGATFDKFLKEVPLVSAWIDSGQPLDEPEPLGSVGNCRKYLCNGEAQVTGLMLVGDAAVHTNPTAARGIALAVAHARALADFLHEDSHADDPVLATRRWEQATAQLMEPWLKSQIEIDRDRRQQIRACLEGNEMDVAASSRSRLANALAELHDCEVVASAADRLFNLLATPDEIAADRDVMRRLLRAGRHAQSPYLGPSRQQYEQLVGAHVESGH